MARRRRRRLHRRVRGQEGQAGRGQRLCVRSGDQGILLLLVVPNREQKGATASAKARQAVFWPLLFFVCFECAFCFFFFFSSSIEAIETIKFFLNLLHSFSFIPKPGGVRKITLSRFVLAASGTSSIACGAHGRASATRESRAKDGKMKKPSAENETKARLLTSRASGRTRRFLA